MALEKQWYTICDLDLVDSSTAAKVTQSLMFAFVQLLTGAAGTLFGTLGPIPAAARWTVVGSSDGATAGMDGVNRWTDVTKVVYGAAGAAHSWIVLESPAGMGSGANPVWLTFDTSGTGSTLWNVHLQFTKPTTSVTTARPSVGAESGFAGTATHDAAAGNHRVHCTVSESGDFWIFYGRPASGKVYGVLGVTKLSDLARTNDAAPAVLYHDMNTTPANFMNIGGNLTPGWSPNFSNTAGNFRGRSAGNNAAITLVALIYAAGNFGNLLPNFPANPFDGAYDGYPVPIASPTTGHVAWRGRLLDVRYIPGTLAAGTSGPANGGTERVIMSANIAFPFTRVPTL